MKKFKCDNGNVYICKDRTCLVCANCTDIFWDYTNGPYMVICKIRDDICADGTCTDYMEETNEEE